MFSGFAERRKVLGEILGWLQTQHFIFIHNQYRKFIIGKINRKNIHIYYIYILIPLNKDVI